MSESESDRVEKVKADSTNRRGSVEAQQVEESCTQSLIIVDEQAGGVINEGGQREATKKDNCLENANSKGLQDHETGTSNLKTMQNENKHENEEVSDAYDPSQHEIKVEVSHYVKSEDPNETYEQSSADQKIGQLITNDFEGPCKFGLIFPGKINQNTPSVYVSNLLNKVFIRMGTTLVIQFTLDPTEAPTTDLYIRATAKFCTVDSVQFPVERCKVHFLEDDPRNKAHEFVYLCKCTYFNLAGHVIRSPTQGAIYCYDPNSRRHSVLSPLKSRSHDVVYSFHCKSSCQNGIDRRPLQVVFTLEQLNGVVLGQTSLNFKICTSPKRDRDRNENEFKKSQSVKRKAVVYEVTEPSRELSAGEQARAKMRNALVAIRHYLQQVETQCRTISQVMDTYEEA